MTLVELLVVVVILSILSSLSLAGLTVARTNAKRAKTAATIRKLSEIILPAYEEYENRRPVIGNQAQLLAAGRTTLSLVKQAAIRRLMTLELPERASDFRDAFQSGTVRPKELVLSFAAGATTVSGTLSEIPPAVRRYYSLTTSVANPTSSELLHLIVTRGPVADPDVVAHFRDDEVRDTNQNGLPEFVDGWNKPIAFRRWPTGFQSAMQPIDGTNRSIDTVISNNGHRLVPLIFSAGLDGAYDVVHEPTSTPLSYFPLAYDPFAVAATPPSSGPLAVAPQSPAIAGSVVLVPVPVSSPGSRSPTLFTALPRLAANATIPATAFQTVGSERDTGSADNEGTPNGVVESIDNIHNHDMTR